MPPPCPCSTNLFFPGYKNYKDIPIYLKIFLLSMVKLFFQLLAWSKFKGRLDFFLFLLILFYTFTWFLVFSWYLEGKSITPKKGFLKVFWQMSHEFLSFTNIYFSLYLYISNLTKLVDHYVHETHTWPENFQACHIIWL